MELTDTQQRYQAHIEAAEATGQSLAAYAREHNLNVHCLYSERQRQRRRQPKSGAFLKVQDVSQSPVISMSMLQVRLPNGVNLAVPTDQVALADILHLLARL